MKKNLIFSMGIATLLLSSIASCTEQQQPTASAPLRVIFETDMGNDVDDALALDMLYKYQEAGEIDILMISSNKLDSCAVPYIQYMNQFYGHSDIPVATSAFENLAVFENSPTYVEKAMKSGLFEWPVQPIYDSVKKYREILASQPDSSVVIITVGFSTNLKLLLASQPDEFSNLEGRDLVARKVKFLSMMGGAFDNTDRREFNIVVDIPSANMLFEQWPTQVIVSPWETGAQIFFKAEDLAKITYADPHPLKVGYESYLPMPYNRECWDETSVIAAIEGTDMFTCSERGEVSVNEVGVTTFVPQEDGRYIYITVDSIQAAKVADHITSIVLKTPKAFEK